jgi:hypothetical protein
LQALILRFRRFSSASQKKEAEGPAEAGCGQDISKDSELCKEWRIMLVQREPVHRTAEANKTLIRKEWTSLNGSKLWKRAVKTPMIRTVAMPPYLAMNPCNNNPLKKNSSARGATIETVRTTRNNSQTFS